MTREMDMDMHHPHHDDRMNSEVILSKKQPKF